MKTTASKPPLILLLLLLTSQTLYAFYDPQTQRWINRDPIDEVGFESARNAPAQVDEARAVVSGSTGGGYTSSQAASFALTPMVPPEINLYTYCANAPVAEVDAYGLELFPPMGPKSPLGTPGTPTPDNCAPCTLEAAALAASAAAGVVICVKGAGSSAGRVACRAAVVATAVAAKKLSECLKKQYGF